MVEKRAKKGAAQQYEMLSFASHLYSVFIALLRHDCSAENMLNVFLKGHEKLYPRKVMAFTDFDMDALKISLNFLFHEMRDVSIML